MLAIYHDLVRSLLRIPLPYLFATLVTAGYALSALGRLLPVRRKQVAGYQGSGTKSIMRGMGVIAAATAVATSAYLIPSANRQPVPEGATKDVAHKNPADENLAHQKKGFLLGVAGPGNATARTIPEFGAAVGEHPGILLTYSGWNEPFHTELAQSVADQNAQLLIQMSPPSNRTSMEHIAAGEGDAYLRSYARDVKAFGHRVMLSFAAEANGSWYSWGWSHTPAATWVSAWRHVVDVFRAEHVTNVTWVWTMNVQYPSSGPISAYWPGARYVDMVGIDGYFIHRSDTFDTVFGPTLREIRAVTSKPVLLSETAIGKSPSRPAQITSLFDGARAQHLRGLVWFDIAQHEGEYHQDWRLEGDPASLAAFRNAF